MTSNIDQPIADGSGFRPESLDEGFNHPSLVASVMIDGRLGIGVCFLNEHVPDRFLVLDCVRPERVMGSGPVLVYEEADEIGEHLIRNALDVQVELDVTSLDLR